MNHTLTEIFEIVDDFYQNYSNSLQQLALPAVQRKNSGYKNMHPSEIMTIMIFFHMSQFRNFKAYYLSLRNIDKSAFPKLLSYNQG